MGVDMAGCAEDGAEEGAALEAAREAVRGKD